MRGPEAGSAAAGVVHAVEDGTLRGSQPSRGDTRGTNAGVHYVAPDHRIREFSTPLRMAGVPVSPSFEAERAGPSGRLRSPVPGRTSGRGPWSSLPGEQLRPSRAKDQADPDRGSDWRDVVTKQRTQ